MNIKQIPKWILILQTAVALGASRVSSYWGVCFKWVGVQVGWEPQTELYIKWAIRYDQTLGTNVFQRQLYIKWAELGPQIYI